MSHKDSAVHSTSYESLDLKLELFLDIVFVCLIAGIVAAAALQLGSFAS